MKEFIEKNEQDPKELEKAVGKFKEEAAKLDKDNKNKK